MKAIILSFIITTGLLLVGCGGGGGGGSSGGSSSPEPLLNTTADGGGDGSGGGGDGNNGGGGGNRNGSNGDGGGERPSLPAEVELSISPFIDGLRIQWHNLSAIEGAGGIYIHLNLTGGNPPRPNERKIAIEDFSDDSYEIDGLDNGTAYRLVGVRVEQANNTFWVIDNITWSEPWEVKTNALDNNGNGIVVGANHDGDGRADGVDTDDDNDGRPNSMDDCRLGEIGWSSTNSMLDYDSDGCRDEGTANGGYGEDEDDDNDGIKDSMDKCVNGEKGWQSNDMTDFDRDGCRDHSEDTDHDNDGFEDNVDIDDDGDGLIEIGTAEELDAVRFVLDGTGFRANETAMLNQTGCGDGVDMMVCNGYELVRDISLTDYIADNYPMVGWQPIAHFNSITATCTEGSRFTGIFDGNGFEVRGLFINRPTQDCIGLFGQASGTIRHLGVIADRVIGRNGVGGLVGGGERAEITQSYAVSNVVRGSNLGNNIAGLVGYSDNTYIIQSYAVSGEVNGSHISVGGLVGESTSSFIVQSYAVSNLVKGVNHVGGLVGRQLNEHTTVIQSYAVSGVIEINEDNFDIGGLIGSGGTSIDAYWDTETSGRDSDGSQLMGSSGQTTMALRSPTDYGDTGIYSTWDDGAMVDGINVNTTIWCDEDAGGMIEDDERRGAGDTNGDNRVWDFGTSTDYPAIRCTGDSLADQRAWWSLSGGDPQLNQDRLDAYLNGTLP